MQLQRIKAVALVIVILLCSGCANQYSVYHSMPSVKSYHKHAVYPHCLPGGLQAPINIPQQIWRDDEASALHFSFTTSADHLVNSGNTFKVLFNSNKNTLTIDHEIYHLQEIYMSIPSATYVLGQRYPMEWNFLYHNNTGATIIVASLVKLGVPNSDMALLISQFPHRYHINSISLRGVQFSGRLFLPIKQDYYSFEGSLDFPPCTPHVRWYVLKQPITASITQINAFRKYFKHNARPLQALNGRQIITNA